MIRRLIIFMLRSKFGLRRYQQFRFDNQKSKKDVYYFTSTKIYKIEGCVVKESGVSINWLLNDNCKIIKL